MVLFKVIVVQRPTVQGTKSIVGVHWIGGILMQELKTFLYCCDSFGHGVVGDIRRDAGFYGY